MALTGAARLALLCCFWPSTWAKDVDVTVDGPVLGIDLGTTYACAGVVKNGAVEIIPNAQGNRVTPTYVAFTGTERLVGEAAKNQAVANPSSTVYDVKRFIGRRYKEVAEHVDTSLLPYSIVDKSGKPSISVKVNGETQPTLTPEEVSAMVLRRLREDAEAYLGTPVRHAVITVPAQFNDAQRAATKDAAAIAGLEVLRILNEPTAAAIAYGLDKEERRTILVFDLGGGTLDVSVLRAAAGTFDVLATSGVARLGGEDFDERLVAHVSKAFAKKNDGKDPLADKAAVQRIRVEVEKAKRRLSATHQAPVRLDSLIDGINLQETVSRAQFEKLNADFFKKTLEPVKTALSDAKLDPSQIDDVIMVGGSSRIPKLQQLLKGFFDGKELSRGVNPDEAVAYGAAVQAAMFSAGPKTHEVILNDVTPLTLGIETVGGLLTRVISRNAPLPAKNSTVLTTHYDEQGGLNLKVFEGERTLTRDNHFLGRFQIRDIEAAPRGKPQIEVTFEVDADGILTVSAEDRASGKTEKRVIKSDKERLTPEQIEAMIKEAEAFADSDVRLREQAVARVSLDVFLASLESAATAEGVAEEEKAAALEAVAAARAWLAENPTAEVEELAEKRQEITHLCGTLAAIAEPDAPGAAEGESESGGADEL